MSGLTLIYGTDRDTAFAGETVTFTAWMTNESPDVLHLTELVPGSFTNEALQGLSYDQEPNAEVLMIGLLAPGETAQRSWSYTVRATDVVHGGCIISGIRVRAASSGGVIRDEHDAVIAVAGTHERRESNKNGDKRLQCPDCFPPRTSNPHCGSTSSPFRPPDIPAGHLR